MGDQKYGLVGFMPYRNQQFLHLFARETVERAEGFVHQKQIGIGGKCPSDANPLAHAAGQFIGCCVGKIV